MMPTFKAHRHQTVSMAAAMLGLTVPLMVGVQSGHPDVGVAMALGGLALGGEGGSPTDGDAARALLYALLAGGLAMLLGTHLRSQGTLASVSVPLVAFLAALVGGISRPLVRASTLFILYLIIAANLHDLSATPMQVSGLFLVGAAWTALVFMVLRRTLRALRGPNDLSPATSPPPPFNALLARWIMSLADLPGWHYALRLGLCLCVAEGFDRFWPGHHGYWASVTVVLVIQRDMANALKRNAERAVGTLVGVLLTALLLLASPSAWVLVLIVAWLSAIRPMLRDINYVLYTAMITPLIILLLDFGHGFSWQTLSDRLVATLVGCAISLLLGFAIWPQRLPSGQGQKA